MASVARLPSLQSVGGHVTQQVLNQIPSPPKFGGGATNKKRVNVHGKTKHATGKEEKDGRSKIDTESERDERQKLGPESGLQDEPLVEDQPEKLEELKLNLSSAEAAKRRGKMDVVYNCYLTLANYFDQSEDTFLSNHFYKLCLDTSVKVRGDGRRKEAEANFNMGTTYEKQGNFIDALQCFENFYALTNGRLWQMDDSEKNLFSMACECLQRVYTTVALQLKESNPSEGLSYLLKAYKVAKEGDDIPGRGEASYILGCAYQDNDDAETALLYHNEYFSICQQVDDLTGMGRACRALAKSYEKQMDVEAAVKHLESFVELSEKSGDWIEQQRACSSLGEMLNCLGKYEESASYFEKSYKLARKINDDENKEMVRTEYGIVMANLVMQGLTQAMNNTSMKNIGKLLFWKQVRKDGFAQESPIPRKHSTDMVKDKTTDDEEISCENLAQSNVEEET